jgi:hypothetical protein
MTSAVTTFLVAVSAASAVCYLLMTRMQNRRVRRASPGGGVASHDGGYSSDSDGWSLGSLFGHASTGAAGNATDSCGGWDSGSGGNDCGGGDSGGGGDGGGGGD